METTTKRYRKKIKRNLMKLKLNFLSKNKISKYNVLYKENKLDENVYVYIPFEELTFELSID